MSANRHSAVHAIERPDKRLFWLYVIYSLATGPFFPFTFLPLLFKYETLRYRFDDQGVLMSWGLLWRRETFLTYARIQDIHLSRGLIERWLGLATINVQTASGSSSAEMSIVGMPEYAAIRDFLYSRMRGANLGDETGEVCAASDEPLELLRRIAAETRRLRLAIEGRSVVEEHEEKAS